MSPGFAMREASRLLSLSSGTSPRVLCNCARLKLISRLAPFLSGSWALQQFSSGSVELRHSGLDAVAYPNHRFHTAFSKLPSDLLHTGVCTKRFFCSPRLKWGISSQELPSISSLGKKYKAKQNLIRESFERKLCQSCTTQFSSYRGVELMKCSPLSNITLFFERIPGTGGVDWSIFNQNLISYCMLVLILPLEAGLVFAFS